MVTARSVLPIGLCTAIFLVLNAGACFAHHQKLAVGFLLPYPLRNCTSPLSSTLALPPLMYQIYIRQNSANVRAPLSTTGQHMMRASSAPPVLKPGQTRSMENSHLLGISSGNMSPPLPTVGETGPIAHLRNNDLGAMITPALIPAASGAGEDEPVSHCALIYRLEQYFFSSRRCCCCC